MGKLQPIKPLLIVLYGMPGSGKTFLARQLCQQITAAHIEGDRLRHELFEAPTYNKDENHVVGNLMTYMAKEFLGSGVSVVFDTNAARISQRRSLINLARQSGAEPILVWLQIDHESAFRRARKRDRRGHDDKYAQDMDPVSFQNQLGSMQNPEPTEHYLVLSGKHVFNTQKSATLRYLAEKRLINLDPTKRQLSKPGLINMVPNPAAGRVDLSRRNINIH